MMPRDGADKLFQSSTGANEARISSLNAFVSNNENATNLLSTTNDENTKVILKALHVPALSSAASLLLQTMMHTTQPSQLNGSNNQQDATSCQDRTSGLHTDNTAEYTHETSKTSGKSLLQSFTSTIPLLPASRQPSKDASENDPPPISPADCTQQYVTSSRIEELFNSHNASSNINETRSNKRVKISKNGLVQQIKNTQPTTQPIKKQKLVRATVFGGKRNHDEAFSKPGSHTNTVAVSPFEHLKAILSDRGYSIRTYSSADMGYQAEPTPLQIASFGNKLLGAIQSSNEALVSKLLRCGLSRNPCNKFGDNVLNLVCKRGNDNLLRCLLEHGSSVQVADSFGRTPLHHSAWAAQPCFKSISMILNRSLDLLRIKDGNEKTPLECVTKDNWAVWVKFLDDMKDVYWPKRQGMKIGSDDEAPPRARLGVLKEPCQTLSVELAAKVASGAIDIDSIG